MISNWSSMYYTTKNKVLYLHVLTKGWRSISGFSLTEIQKMVHGSNLRKQFQSKKIVKKKSFKDYL